MERYYVYFIESASNHKIYVGSTSKHPTERLREHNNGANAWTRNNGPFKLMFFEEYTCEKCARLREEFYKSGIGRQIKEAIIGKMKQIGRDSSVGRAAVS